MLVLRQKLHICTCDQQNFSSDWLSIAWETRAPHWLPKVEVMELEPPLLLWKRCHICYIDPLSVLWMT